MKTSPVSIICSLMILATIMYSCEPVEEFPTIITIPVAYITESSALSGGEITSDGGSLVTNRGVCWSTMPNSTIWDAHTSDSSGMGSYQSTITGLQPETSYYVKAYATNRAGTAYGQEVVYDNSWKQCGIFIDIRDKKDYEWVRIGDQVWMAENLAYLPSVSPSSEGSNTEPYYYVYGYEGSSVNEARATDNYDTYGVLYNWPAAMNACPDGWHLPTDEEWTQLTDFFGGEVVAGGKLKETGTAHWYSPNTGASNETGFTALLGGYRHGNGDFCDIGKLGYWWSATEYNTDGAWYRSMTFSSSNVYRYRYDEHYGWSVRCLRD